MAPPGAKTAPRTLDEERLRPMATGEQIQTLLNALAQIASCERCGTRLRFGDLDCPHCGADLEASLRTWAERVIDELYL